MKRDVLQGKEKFGSSGWDCVAYTESPVRAAPESSFEAVRALGRELPDVHETTMYGAPALKLGKRLVACVAIHRSAEPGSLVVRTDFEQRAEWIGDDPDTFYVTGHYENHPVVLVRAAHLREDQLRDLLKAARECILADARRKKAKKTNNPGAAPSGTGHGRTY